MRTRLILPLALVVLFSRKTLSFDVAPTTPPLILTPDSLQQHLRGPDIMRGLLRVQVAKDRVTEARLNLLPSLDLGTLLVSAGAPTFLLSRIQFLAPFLVPARWFDVGRSKALFESDRLSFQLLQLNSYASALSLFVGLRSDMSVIRYLNEELLFNEEIMGIVQGLRQDGLVPSYQVDFAQGTLALLRARRARLQGLVISEKASLRQALALSADQELQVTSEKLMTHEGELWTAQELADEAYRQSPEARQLDRLKDSAEWDRKSRRFSFIGSFTATSVASNGEGASWADDKFKSEGFLNLRFAVFPQISIVNRQIRDLELQQEQLRLGLFRLAETTLGQLNLAKERLAGAQVGLEAARRAAEDLIHALRLRKMALDIPVMSAVANFRAVAQELVEAERDVELLRVTLHRMTLTQQFGRFPLCRVAKPKTSSSEERGPEGSTLAPNCMAPELF